MQKALIAVQPRELADMRRAMSRGLVSIAGEYVTSPQEAEHLLETSVYDLLIATVEDAHDPHVALVNRCDRLHPDTARLIISDDPRIRDRVPAHLAIRHRLAGREIQAGIVGAIRWRDRLGHARLGQLVEGARKLPSLPDCYVAVMQELNGPDPSMHRVGMIVQRDPALATTVLRVVNSAMFGLRREVGDIVQAVALLGARTVSSLVLASSMYSTRALDQKYVSQMWHEALAVGTLARRIAGDAGLGRTDVEEAHLAGLIHDIGDLVLFQHWPDDFLAIDTKRRAASEHEIFGATHADIGGYLTTLWELPVGVVDAVTHHHSPSESRHTRFVSPATVVHIARAYVDARGHLGDAVFDMEHLWATGVGPQVERWFSLAQSGRGAA